MRCPSESEVDDVLDRVAPPALAREVRRHVAACERCLARHGAGFELELWSDALGTAIHVAPFWSRARRVAALAAAVVIGGVVLLPALRTMPGSQDPSTVHRMPMESEAVHVAGTASTRTTFKLVEFVVESSRSGSDGRRSFRRSWTDLRPERVQLRETLVSSEGLTFRRDRAELAGSILRIELVSGGEKEEGP